MGVQITKTYKVEGVLTDVTSWTLGVVRTDTSAEVVATGTAMTHASTGTYTYEFDEPTTGLTYTVTYVLVAGGNTTTWDETVVGGVEETIPLPALTGDNLVDTLNSLVVERLRVSRDGPKPSYMVHGHRVDWTQYLDYLDKRIMALRKEIAMVTPVEEVGTLW